MMDDQEGEMAKALAAWTDNIPAELMEGLRDCLRKRAPYTVGFILLLRDENGDLGCHTHVAGNKQAAFEWLSWLRDDYIVAALKGTAS